MESCNSREMNKVFPLVCSRYLSSWTGLGRSGHVRFPTFGQNFACCGFDFLLTKFLNDSAWFCLEKLKKHIFLLKTLELDKKTKR